MESQNNSSNKPSKKGYGKRPLWQWIVLYVVLGVIVYGAIYYFMMMNNSGTGAGY